METVVMRLRLPPTGAWIRWRPVVERPVWGGRWHAFCGDAVTHPFRIHDVYGRCVCGVLVALRTRFREVSIAQAMPAVDVCGRCRKIVNPEPKPEPPIVDQPLAEVPPDFALQVTDELRRRAMRPGLLAHQTGLPINLVHAIMTGEYCPDRPSWARISNVIQTPRVKQLIPA